MHLVVTRGQVYLAEKMVEADSLLMTESMGAELQVDRELMRAHGMATASERAPKAAPMNVAPE